MYIANTVTTYGSRTTSRHFARLHAKWQDRRAGIRGISMSLLFVIHHLMRAGTTTRLADAQLLQQTGQNVELILKHTMRHWNQRHRRTTNKKNIWQFVLCCFVALCYLHHHHHHHHLFAETWNCCGATASLNVYGSLNLKKPKTFKQAGAPLQNKNVQVSL